MIKRCDLCDKSYDSGREYHPAHCDGGAAIRATEKRFRDFQKLSVDKKLDFLYKRLIKLEEDIDNVPRGPLMIG